jgi:hypothetical protein
MARRRPADIVEPPELTDCHIIVGLPNGVWAGCPWRSGWQSLRSSDHRSIAAAYSPRRHRTWILYDRHAIFASVFEAEITGSGADLELTAARLILVSLDDNHRGTRTRQSDARRRRADRMKINHRIRRLSDSLNCRVSK